MAGNQEIIARINELKDGKNQIIASLGEVKIAIEKLNDKFDNFTKMIVQN